MSSGPCPDRIRDRACEPCTHRGPSNGTPPLDTGGTLGTEPRVIGDSPGVPGLPAGGRPVARPPLASVVGIAAILIGFLVAGLLQVRHTWFPGTDLALAELFVRQVPRHVISTGPYSSFRGFSHPLPYGFYVAWPPYELFGRRSAALLTGAMWFNGVVLAGIAWVLVRRGRSALAILVVAAVGVMVRLDTGSLLLVPWNPYQAALPFLGLLVVAPFVARGERWLVPVAVALASWAAGIHLLYAPTAAVVLVAALAGLGGAAWRRRGVEPLKALVAPLGVAAGVAFALWLPTVVDVIRRGGDGNTGALLRFALHGDPTQAVLPFHDVVALASWELAWRPAFTGVSVSTFYIFPAKFPGLLLLGALAAIGAWRRRRGWELAALGIGALAIAVATVALARSPVPLGGWFLLPLRLSALWFACVTLYSLGGSARAVITTWTARRRAGARAQPRPWPRSARTRLGAVGAVGAVWLGVALLVAWPGPHPALLSVDPPPDLAALRRALPDTRSVVVRVEVFRPSTMPVGYLLALDRAGFDVHVPADQAWRFGAWRARPAPEGAYRLWITQQPASAPPPEAGARLVYETGPRAQLFGPDLPVGIWRLR